MIRFIVIVLASLGAAYALGRLYPPAAAVAWVLPLVGLPLTWIMLGAAGAGAVAYKVTK